METNWTFIGILIGMIVFLAGCLAWQLHRDARNFDRLFQEEDGE